MEQVTVMREMEKAREVVLNVVSVLVLVVAVVLAVWVL